MGNSEGRTRIVKVLQATLPPELMTQSAVTSAHPTARGANGRQSEAAVGGGCCMIDMLSAGLQLVPTQRASVASLLNTRLFSTYHSLTASVCAKSSSNCLSHSFLAFIVS